MSGPMPTTLRTTLSIEKELFAQAKALAQQLQLAPDELFALALARFLRDYANTIAPEPMGAATRMINQGDIYWVQVDNPNVRKPGIRHPHVVIQDDLLNHSRIHTVVACALTTNLTQVGMPGNVLLEAGEANLPQQSVVEVSKISAIEKAQLGDYIGAVSVQRVQEILAGLRFLQRSFFARGSR
jgi:mRNA interferase MazF